MLEDIAKSLIGLVAESPQEKDRAQEQLKPVLDGRFTPCLELWRELWQFGDDQSPRGDSAASDDVIARLSEKVDDFLHKWGALISVQCLAALARFQGDLRDVRGTNDDLARSVKIGALTKQLVPWSDKTSKNVTEQHPGLLLLLRDQLGSNSRAVSSVLK